MPAAPLSFPLQSNANNSKGKRGFFHPYKLQDHAFGNDLAEVQDDDELLERDKRIFTFIVCERKSNGKPGPEGRTLRIMVPKNQATLKNITAKVIYAQ